MTRKWTSGRFLWRTIWRKKKSIDEVIIDIAENKNNMSLINEENRNSNDTDIVEEENVDIDNNSDDDNNDDN